jgi:hypothetical protein
MPRIVKYNCRCKKQVHSDLLLATDLYNGNYVLLMEQLASEYLEMFGSFVFVVVTNYSDRRTQ